MEREPEPVASSLDRLARSLGAPRPVVLAAVFARWEELVGRDVAAHATPLSLRDGVLVIAVDQPAWATQLRYLASDLIARLAAETEGGEVREVQIRVRGGEPARRGSRPSRTGPEHPG